jgi:tetratricopeptide (TPR) repeat protein
VGCSTDKSRSIVFKAEKLLHKAERQKETAGIKPDLKTKEFRDNIKAAYTDVTTYCWKNIDSLPIEKFPSERQDLESVAFLAVNKLSQIYYAEEKFDSVILVINQLLNFAELEGFQLLTSQLNLARAYQSIGNLDEAIRIYYFLIDTLYPPVGNNNEIITQVLNLPLEIINIQNLLGRNDAAAKEKRAAEEYYHKLIADWPNSTLETAARGNLARLYHDYGEWDKAIDNLSMLRDSSGAVDIKAAMMIAGITAEGKRDYRKGIELYSQLLAQTDDTTLLPSILMRIGMTHFADRDYNKCWQTMTQISDEYPSFFQSNPLPQKYIAESFQNLGDWVRAENEFKWLIDNYSTTEAAFDAHLSIAEHYKEIDNEELAGTWLQRAREFYTGMANRYRGTSIEASAISYLAEVSRIKGEWELAAQYLENLYNMFPRTEIGRRGLINAASVYREKLGKGEKADSLIERYRRELIPDENGKNIDVMTDDI